MFESAELDHKADKTEYAQAVRELRADLLDTQFELGQLGKFSVLVLLNGVEGAGKGATVGQLNAWMDPRHILTYAYGDATEDERHRPYMWRFWRSLPPDGKIGILVGNWYADLVHARAEGRMKRARLDQSLDEINRFEAMLANEGVLILKFWLHLSVAQQAERFRALSKSRKTRWRVTDDDWRYHQHYPRHRKAADHVLRLTSSAHAPWFVVSGADPRYRELTVARTLLETLRRRIELEHKGWKPRANAAPLPPRADRIDVLSALELDQPMSKTEYVAQLEDYQGRLALLTRRPAFRKRSLVLVFEGMDAAGKGGAIRRITSALDARQYRIVPIAAPTEEERAHPYLWRFWRHVPRAGWVTIFDRSWYGRVLVERVEGFCGESDWMRAYAEINDFEQQLARAGAVVVKFWLSISPDEQLRRFHEREKTRFKRFKITDDDWRNRDKWPAYERAVCDMVDRSSTALAPWTLVEANNKYHARIKVLRTVCARLEAALA